MEKEQINDAISDYKEQEKLRIINQKSYREKIKELENLIIDSYNTSIYRLIYKKEYGDFVQFTQIIAKNLRNNIK